MWATSSMNRYWSHLNFRLNKLQQIVHHILKVGIIWFISHSNVSMMSILLFRSILFLFTLCTFFIYNVYILSINIMEYDLFWTNNAILYGNKEWFVMLVISVKLRGLVFSSDPSMWYLVLSKWKNSFWV